MKINRDSPATRYGCAAVLVALAIALRLLLDAELGSGYAFITLFLAILLTAWYGGFGPAIAAVVLGAVSATYFVLAPRGSFSLAGRDERVALLLYLCIGVGIAMIAGSMHAARKRAELAADAARRRAELIDQTYDALLVWDLHGAITFWNRGAERLYGIRREDALGRVSHELLQTKVDGGVVAMISALQRDGSWEGELEHTNGDQRRIVVESRMTLVQDGAQTYVVEANRDITSVRESEARLRTVTNTARVGLVIVDERHCYRYANRAYAEILNLPENNLVGLRVADVLAPVYEAQIRPRLDRAFQGERVSYGLQTPPIGPGAENRHYAVSYEPGVDRSGKIVVVVIADITEQARAEKAMGLLAAIVNSSFDAIVGKDLNSIVTSWNLAAERMFGYTADEMIGQSILQLIPPDRRSEEEGILTRIRRGESTEHFDTLRVRKDGGLIEVSVTVSPIKNSGGEIIGASKVARDITERKRADAALREMEKEKQLAFEASRLKSEFLANMSHELRTPLNCIIGFTEFLVDEKPGSLNPKQKEYLTDVYHSSKHLLQLINDVLDLAKVEAGKVELHLETFPLAKAIEEVCAVVKAIAQKKGVSIRWNVAPDAGSVTLDQQKFKQVCYNLLANAVKFTDSGGEVEITVSEREGGRFEARVKDTGIGIKQEDLHRLFREFEQLDSGADRRFEGTGLGLALTKKLVESQGGSIGVESEYGTGSTFFAVMPKTIAEVKET